MRRFLVAAALIAAVAGCVPIGHGRHLVLGVGMFSASKTNGASVVKASTVGIHLGDRRLNVGASTVTTVEIPTNSNVILEIK